MAHTKEKPSMTNFCSKIGKALNSKEWAKSDFKIIECLQQINSNSKFKVTCKNANFECHCIRTHTKEKLSKIQHYIGHFAFIGIILKLNGHPEHFGFYYSWWNHKMRFKLVHFYIKTQHLELVNLRCVAYSQPIPLSLSYIQAIHLIKPLAIWPLVDPGWLLHHDLWSQQCIMLWSGVLPTKFGDLLMLSGVLELLWPSKASYPALLPVPQMFPVQCLASGHLHEWGTVYLTFSSMLQDPVDKSWYRLILISKAMTCKTPPSLSYLLWEFWMI